MTDHWDGWYADQPDFDGPDDAEFGDLSSEHPDDGGYPVEGFGPADADGAGAADNQPGPIGYDDVSAGPSRFDPYAQADPYSADLGGSESGFGAVEVPAEVGFGAADPPVGADPDLAPYGDAGQWSEGGWSAPVGSGLVDEFGPPPEPVDGFPWVDPALLGDPAAPPPEPAGAAPGPAELADYAGQELPADGDPWAALADSDDPATSTLARFWSSDDR